METEFEVIGASSAATTRPRVRSIPLADIRAVLGQGLSDFRSNPTHLVFLGLIYPVVGLILGRIASGNGALPLVYPLVAGFALLGPVAAIGLYELSRRRERGLDTSARHMLDVLRSPRIGAILILGAMLAGWFLLWLRVAMLISDAVIPRAGALSAGGFAHAVLATQAGWSLILVGTAAGFVFAVVALTLSVVSFPLLLDREVGSSIEEEVVVALQTSARAVLANPVTMAVWGLVVVAGLAIGAATLLVGLAVIMPVLGHATWHLYRRLVAD